ncbi:MAG: SsrA-binding protein SmpB [Acidimicrobiia bacterium]
MSRRGDQQVITNRKARHEYTVLDTYEAGVMLLGSEVKSLRDNKGNLQDAYARIHNNEVFLHGMHILPYGYSRENPDPVRIRKLLLNQKEILEISRALEEQGTTLIPLRVYFLNGRAKVEIAVCKGKRQYDKRQALKARDAAREKERALKGMRD